MATVHVTSRYAGSGVGKNQPVIRKAYKSQTMTVAGKSTVVAPPQNSELGDPIIDVFSDVAIYGAFGSDPDATSGVRDIIPANERIQVYCDPGDTFAWILAS